jgi:hypothetical protein
MIVLSANKSRIVRRIAKMSKLREIAKILIALFFLYLANALSIAEWAIW